MLVRIMEPPIYHAPEPSLEAHSRLVSLLSVCEHELASLQALDDPRLDAFIERMEAFHDDLVVAVAEFDGDA